MLLKIGFLLRFLEAELSDVFAELYDSVEYYWTGETSMGKEKCTFLIVKEFFAIVHRECKIEGASGKFGQIFACDHAAESPIGVNHLDAEIFGYSVPEAIRSYL